MKNMRKRSENGRGSFMNRIEQRQTRPSTFFGFRVGLATYEIFDERDYYVFTEQAGAESTYGKTA